MRAWGRRGFALIAALWALVLVGAIAGVYLAESRHAVRVSENRSAELQARQAALAGLERAHNALERLQVLSLDNATPVDMESRARLRSVWNHLELALAELAESCLGAACYEIAVRDLGATLNVNLAGVGALRSFFLALGVDYREADIAAQSIGDWIDADDLHRARGAEREYYLALPFPYEPRNGPIAGFSELRRVRGLDGRLFDLAVPHLSMEGDGRINLNAAPEPVLAALPGLGPEALWVVRDARRRGLFFANLFELALRLSPAARTELQESMSEIMRLVVFEPQQIEVTVIGRFAGLGVRVGYRAVYVRAGERVALLKRSRWEP